MVVRLLPRPQRTTRLWVPGDPSGLPLNGLVGLWDPYRDTYGRNFLPVGSETFTIGSGWFKESGAESITVEGGYPDPDGGNNAYRITVVTNGVTKILIRLDSIPRPAYVTHSFGMQIKAVSVPEGNPLYVTIGGNKIAGGLVTGDWGFRYCQHMYTTDSITYGGVELNAVPPSGQTVVFDAYHPQLNLGSTLFPYSAPAGEPGTLQTSLDYSGNGNHMTLGADTNVSTDDPAYTGTAWQFDGGDYMTAGRPAQLEVAQPWWGFGVYYINQSGVYECLVSKASTSNASGGYGFIVNKTPEDKIRLSIYRSDTTRIETNTASSVSTGWHWISYGWDEASIIIDADLGNTGATEMTTYAPDVTHRLTFGAYSFTPLYFFTGSIALAGFYSRFPSLSERTRIALYVKSLMAQRGITLP